MTLGSRLGVAGYVTLGATLLVGRSLGRAALVSLAELGLDRFFRPLPPCQGGRMREQVIPAERAARAADLLGPRDR